MFTDLAKSRRSMRKFASRQVEQEKIDAIIEAALRAPSGRGARPWAFVVVRDEESLAKLSVAKPMGAAFLKGASVGIVICGDPSASHLWIEDCAIAAVSMQYAAHSMGLGTCWVQMRGNNYNEKQSSRNYIAELLDLPGNLDVECIVAVGYPAEEMAPYRKEDLAFDKVSYERYGLKNV